MFYRSLSRLLRVFFIFSLLLPGLAVVPGSATVGAPRGAGTPPIPVIVLAPDQMAISGDVATRLNSAGTCTAAWFDGMPQGTAIVGVNPTSCNPADWKGGALSAEIQLSAEYGNTVYLLQISWPDQGGKGLHSPEKDRIALITLDGKTVWSKRTTLQSTFNDYYGAEHEAIQTTLVVAGAGLHTLSIAVPEHTAWDISQITLSATPMPALLKGVGYSPYRDCLYPGGEILPSTAEIQQDINRLAHISNAVRTYSSLAPNDQIPALARAAGLRVFPGAWLDQPKSTLAQDSAEIAALINIAKNTPAEGLIVGNEYYLRHRSQQALDYLLQYIRQVKNATGTPVTTAEIDDLIFDFSSGTPKIRPEYRPILDELDFVMVHIYPFWGGRPVEGAADYTIQRYKAIRELLKQEYPPNGKRLVIGEAGWPSGGIRPGTADVTPAAQHKYMLELLRLADQEQVELLYFDGFDELWKIEEPGNVGQHWGFAYADRAAKHDFYGVLLPAESLPKIQALQVNKQFLPMVAAASIPRTFPVYTEWPEGPGRFVPSGWMGDSQNIAQFGCERSDPHSGEMAIRATYTPGGSLGWGGILWQYPDKNWGDQPEALDLSWANKVTFWARGKVGGEKVSFFVGGVGSQSDPYHDSLRPEVSTGFVTLTSEWRQYSINLAGKDLSHVIGGFGWSTEACANPAGAIFYLDDIFYEYQPGLSPPPSAGPLFYIYENGASANNHYSPSGWMGDAVPGRLTLSECSAKGAGDTAIKIAYTQQVAGWAAVYWLYPAQNWGDRPGGYDLHGARRITFWARAEEAGARVKIVIGGVGYLSDAWGEARCSSPINQYPDSVCPKIQQWITLSEDWTQYTIDLAKNPRDLKQVVGAFGLLAESPLVVYLDEIRYEFTE